jgi:hypothetical protein
MDTLQYPTQFFASLGQIKGQRLYRTVNRIIMGDRGEFRSVRLEVGDAVRYIDFSKEDKTFCLRGEEAITTTSVSVKLASGRLKAVIP